MSDVGRNQTLHFVFSCQPGWYWYCFCSKGISRKSMIQNEGKGWNHVKMWDDCDNQISVILNGLASDFSMTLKVTGQTLMVTSVILLVQSPGQQRNQLLLSPYACTTAADGDSPVGRCLSSILLYLSISQIVKVSSNISTAVIEEFSVQPLRKNSKWAKEEKHGAGLHRLAQHMYPVRHRMICLIKYSLKYVEGLGGRKLSLTDNLYTLPEKKNAT